MREAARNGYEQAAVYWRERAEAAEAEIMFLKETAQSNTIAIAQALRIPMQPASCVEILLRNAPRAVSKRFLTENMVHTWDFADRFKLADVVICKLRKLLLERGMPGAIETVWGFGYSMTADAAKQLVTECLPAQNAVKDSFTKNLTPDRQSPYADKKRAVG